MLGIGGGLMYTNYGEGGPAIQESEYSINFNGTNGYVDTGDTYQSTIRGSFTISAWAKLDDITAGHSLIGVEITPTDQLHITHFAVGQKIRVYFEADGNDNTLQETDAAVFDTVHVWKHIAVTVTKNSGGNTGIVIYVNGSAVASTTSQTLSEANHNAYTSNLNLYIGAMNDDGSPTNFWSGNIDEFAIWNVALDADAVAAVYNSGVPLDLTSNSGNYDNSGDLVAYYRFNEGNGTTAIDEGGSNNATLVGGATYSNATPA